MRLVAGQAIQRRRHLARIRRIHQIGNRMAFHRMADAELQRQHNNFVFREIVFREFYGPVEDGCQVRGFELFRLPVRTVAFQAKSVGCGGAQQMVMVSAVRRMTGGTALGESGLMAERLLSQVRNVAVAA